MSETHSKEFEAEFSEILKPVTDLNKNWDIDLKQYLDRYLEQIRRASTGFKNGCKSVNFIEAALFIQSCANIYGKKVDYLWNSLLELLKTLKLMDIEDKRQKDITAKKKKEISPNKEKAAGGDDEFELAGPGDYTKSLDMTFEKKRSKPKHRLLKKTFLQLSHKKQYMTRKIAIEDLDEEDEDDRLGYKQEFNVNNVLAPNYMLLDNWNEADWLENDQSDLDPCIHAPSEPPDDLDSPVDVNNRLSLDGNCGELPNHSDCEDIPGGLELDAASHNGEHEIRVEGHRSIYEPENIVTVPEVTSVWDPVKAESDYPTKQIKRRQLFQLPCEAALLKPERKRKLDTAERDHRWECLTRFLMSEMLVKSSCRSSLWDPEYYVLKVLAGKKGSKHSKRPAFTRAEIESYEKVLREEFTGDFNGFETVGEIPTEYPQQGTSPGVSPCSSPIPEVGIEEADDDGLLSAYAGDPLSLEEPQNLAQPWTGYDPHLTAMAERVAAWHRLVRPRIETASARGHFDIHQYGTELLEAFPAGSAKTTLSFQQLMVDKASEDVPRYFLSSLMLANNYNVEITTSDTGDLATDCMELTLLQSRRHHEVLQEYQAPSQQ